MKKAVISGASSGIGKAIAYRLLQLGYFVIGISRTSDAQLCKEENFSFVKVDMTNKNEVFALCEKLKDEDIYILVNSAGFGRFAPHEELAATTIADMVFLNLTAPLLLSNATLRSLKKNGGYLININSIEALKSSRFAALYGATKSGLKAFGDSLFEESRRSELSVVNINPDMTESPFYDKLRFDVGNGDDEKLFTSDIADALEHILSMRKGAVVTEYTIRSLKFAITKKKR